MQPVGDGAHQSGQQRRSQRLDEGIVSAFRQPSAEAGADAGTECDQQQGDRVRHTEDDAERRGPCCRRHGKSGQRHRRTACRRVQPSARRSGIDPAVSTGRR